MLKRLAEEGPRFFNIEQFRMEGRYPAARPGVADVAVYALKSYQVRIYGGYRDGMFLCVEYDRKQKNKQTK